MKSLPTLPRQMPHAQHKALVMGFLEGKSLDDLARFHGLRRSSVESAIRDGLVFALSLAPEPTLAPEMPDSPAAA